jgi:chromosome segregation ATPase
MSIAIIQAYRAARKRGLDASVDAPDIVHKPTIKLFDEIRQLDAKLAAARKKAFTLRKSLQKANAKYQWARKMLREAQRDLIFGDNVTDGLSDAHEDAEAHAAIEATTATVDRLFADARGVAASLRSAVAERHALRQQLLSARQAFDAAQTAVDRDRDAALRVDESETSETDSESESDSSASAGPVAKKVALTATVTAASDVTVPYLSDADADGGGDARLSPDYLEQVMQ